MKSFGTTFSIGGTLVGGLTSIKRTGESRNFIDVTTHGSADGYKEYIAGLKDAGSCELEGLVLPEDAGQGILRTGSDDAQACVITLTDGAEIAFDGFIQSPDDNIPLDDSVTFTASIKITGKSTLTA